MRHKYPVLTVKKLLKSVYITEVIAKIKLGYRFLDHPICAKTYKKLIESRQSYCKGYFSN